MMNQAFLLIATAFVEVGAGLSLLVAPSVCLALLLGVSATTPEGVLVCRVLGAALLALGVTSWLARGDKRCPAQLGLLTGLLIYNGAAAGLLGYAGAVVGLRGMVLWPAVVLHTALAVWCVLCSLGQTGR
jgi:hypothetical protein